MNEEIDLNYMFEEMTSEGMDLIECIGHVKKLYDETARGTKAKQFYYTMWSTLRSQSLVLNEMNRIHKSQMYLHQRIRIQDAIICSLLDKNIDASESNLVDRIVEALKPKPNTIAGEAA